ncbi:hypothetical protein RUM43_013570 [Polyplax serrata]|uniref:Dynein axonemal assembly factor 4 n=1 Tax=Polyplax serrata TaxID=468196 RepID=A0AAN8PI63_POLSC
MPLIVKEFTWKQTEELVTIRIPLYGVSSSSVDIFTSDNYVKASYPPFLFEAFLNSSINESTSTCTISDNEVIFELQKMIPKIWDSLTADISKLEMLEKRKKIIERHHEKTEEERKARKEKLTVLQRLSVQKQIEQDTTIRKVIDDKRNAERTKVMDELNDWVTENENVEYVKTKDVSVLDKAIFHECDTGVEIEVKSTKKLTTETDEGEADTNQKNCSENSVNECVDVFPVPLPRNPGTITINFTHRDFPTPSRESQAPQEEEWLKKQVEARRATGFVAEDLRPEECNPTWLKDKGDSFYKVGNYLGAVSAYSHAIKLGSKLAGLFANRGAAHLGLGNLHKALDDCSQALELMTPHVPANLEARAKCHARRGAILCRLGVPDAGVADFEEALKLLPNDVKLQQDLEHAKSLAKNKPTEEEEEEQFNGLQVISA